MADKQEETDARNLTSQVARLVDLVEYQDESVVSRQIIKGNTGSVTLFAFDEGQALSEHTTPFDALVQVMDGEAEIMITGKPLRLREGDVVLMPANEPHAVRALRRFKMLLTMIRS
jgi:quercetin dioxygenase-like cupin family protein